MKKNSWEPEGNGFVLALFLIFITIVWVFLIAPAFFMTAWEIVFIMWLQLTTKTLPYWIAFFAQYVVYILAFLAVIRKDFDYEN